MKKTLVLLPVLFLTTSLLANNQNANTNNQNINIKMPNQSVYKINGVKQIQILNKNAKPGEPKKITITRNN